MPIFTRAPRGRAECRRRQAIESPQFSSRSIEDPVASLGPTGVGGETRSVVALRIVASESELLLALLHPTQCLARDRARCHNPSHSTPAHPRESLPSSVAPHRSIHTRASGRSARQSTPPIRVQDPPEDSGLANGRFAREYGGGR